MTEVLWRDRSGISKTYGAGITLSLRVLPVPQKFTVPLRFYNNTKGVSLLGNLGRKKLGHALAKAWLFVVAGSHSNYSICWVATLLGDISIIRKNLNNNCCGVRLPIRLKSPNMQYFWPYPSR